MHHDLVSAPQIQYGPAHLPCRPTLGKLTAKPTQTANIPLESIEGDKVVIKRVFNSGADEVVDHVLKGYYKGWLNGKDSSIYIRR